MKQVLEEKCNQTLDRLVVYLVKIKNTFDKDLETEYDAFIEEDIERLLLIKNNCILNVEIFEKIRKCFYVLANYKEAKDFTEKDAGYRRIIDSLLIYFKYIMESILFLIENNFLDQ